MNTVKDMVGIDVGIDDYVAVAISQGDSCGLKVGKVIKISDTRLTCAWVSENGDLPHKWWTRVSSIDHKIKKYMKVECPVDWYVPE